MNIEKALEGNDYMKKRLKIAGIIILILILGVIALILFNNLKIKNSKKDVNKFIEEYNKLSEEKISYVVVEINPKAILEMINNKITNIGCLNEDCENVFNIDIKGKTLNDAVEALYERAKNKGINTSDGVQISSTNNEVKNALENLEYVNYTEINIEKENELLNQVRDNEDMKNKSNELDYNKKLLEFYKNDKDYGTLYTCNIIDNELECYISESFYNNLPGEPSFSNIYTYNADHQKLMNVLEKFNIEYVTNDQDVEGFDLFKIIEIEQIKIKDKLYDVGICAYSSDTETTCNNHIIIESIKESGEYGYLYKGLSFAKLNLINKEYDIKDIEEYRNYQSNIIVGPGSSIEGE